MQSSLAEYSALLGSAPEYRPREMPVPRSASPHDAESHSAEPACRRLITSHKIDID